MKRNFVNINEQQVPIIKGAGGGGGGGNAGGYNEEPNSLFATDILFATIALGEGPLYRINPNGPQDIEVSDSSIDDLINLDGDGGEKTSDFKTLSNPGTTTQAPLKKFGDESITPQNFASPVNLKKGNIDGVPESKVILQDTSAFAWDAIRFLFVCNSLFQQDDQGNVSGHSLTVQVQMFDRAGQPLVYPTGHSKAGQLILITKTISGKTNVAYKFDVTVEIPDSLQSTDGYKFSVEKSSNESGDSRINSNVQIIGWAEIERAPQSYPRTAHIGYALKAINEHVGQIPTFTSMVKGLIVKVPSNYNQPILESGEIDWRQVEVPGLPSQGFYIGTQGYRLQKSGSTALTDPNPQIYVGTWDGSFVYSWTQNPVWIIYDILTNKTYGLGIEEDNIDKYKFYQVAQYCDACDEITGKFQGVDGLADGSYRNKPKGFNPGIIRTLLTGLPNGTPIKERRFICDMQISDVQPTMDILNTIAASFRGTIVYSFGKLSLAVDQPNRYPTMIFNETNIKDGSFSISGGRESDMITGVEVSYVDPRNHYKRETVRIDTDDKNDGSDRSTIENVISLDLQGVTRRSQALRYAQYHIAATKYLRRTISFTTSLEALALAPGDVISVSQNMTGVNYGFGGKVANNSAVGAANPNVTLEHFTFPALTDAVFTNNTYPVALRIIKQKNDRMDLYIVSNNAPDYQFIGTDNVSVGADLIMLTVRDRFNPITGALVNIETDGWLANDAPEKGDLWSLGEWVSPGDLGTNKAGKLFTVAEIERETETEEISIVAKEYVSNVYVDSDTFIDYTPTAYTDIDSAFSAPPPPVFSFRASPRRLQDGSVVVDGIIDNKTERTGYSQNFSTEYFLATPAGSTPVTNAHQSVLNIVVDNSAALTGELGQSILVGKNGYTSTIGEVRLLCNNITSVDSGSNLKLTVEGLNVAFEKNIFKHLLEVNDGTFLGLKGQDFVTIPLVEKTGKNSLKNFIAFADDTVATSANIVAFDKTVDTLTINDTQTGAQKLSTRLPDLPFYVSINQMLDSRFFANNSFYVSGSRKQFEVTNTITAAAGTDLHIELPVRPRDKIFTTLFVDGIEQSRGQFTFNNNEKVAGKRANIVYPVQPGDTEFRIDLDHYTVPAIEIGDNVQTSVNSVFPVIATSYDPLSANYNGALSSNSIFRIDLGKRPESNLSGFSFTNISPNPVGTVANVSANTCTLDYSEAEYPGLFRLANNGIYDLHLSTDYSQLFLTDDLVIPNLPLGITSIKARNINQFSRKSAFSEKSIRVSNLPIQKVSPVEITESLYRDATAGVAVRITVSFTHITGQEVTDYEISYKLDQVEDINEDGGASNLTSFNTVKIPATGVDVDGKIRHTINFTNRGATSGVNTVTVRIVPLNKSIRGVPTTASKTILGKTAKPQNIFNFTGGQQTDQITLFWQYARVNDELADLDLKEVVIRRLQGSHTATLANFIAGNPFVQVAAGVNRKSIPIDTFGTFTYLARTRDTSGNLSESVVATIITTSRPNRNQVVAAYNEDSPSVAFAGITNTNNGQDNFPALTETLFGGVVRFTEDGTTPGSGNPSTLVDNANASSSGFSTIAGSPTDILADGEATYFTEIRDFGSTITAAVFIESEGTQARQTTFNDQFNTIIESSTEATSAGQLKDTSFGGIGSILGHGNTTFTGTSAIRFDSDNQTLMSTTSSGNVYAITTRGDYVGNSIPIAGITKASPAVVTTSGSEHGLVNGDRIIAHDVLGMDEINNKELYVNRVSATQVQLYTDSGRTSALDSSGFTTYTSSGVLDQGDYANANVVAFIAGTIDASTIKLGNTFFANGTSTGGNNYANLSVAGTNYLLVDLNQFNDLLGQTFEGDLGAVSTQVFIRTTTATNADLYDSVAAGGFATGNLTLDSDGNPNFDQADNGDGGFIPYEAGTRSLRQFQLKFVVNNKEPDQFDFTFDKLRYTLEKEVTIFTTDVSFGSSPATVNYSSAGFLNRPVLNFTPIATATAQTALVTSASSTQAQFTLYDIENSASAGLGDGPITVQVTATGV